MDIRYWVQGGKRQNYAHATVGTLMAGQHSIPLR